MPRTSAHPAARIPVLLVLLFLAGSLALFLVDTLIAGAQPATLISCQDLREQGQLVSLSDRDLGGEDETRFCLVARPEEDTFIAYLPNVTATDEFREVKRRYAEALIAGGYDVCRVGVWLPLNREGAQPVPLTAADQLDVPVVCTPRVVARTEAAAAWIGPVQEMLRTIADRVHADLGFTPRRPLTVDLYTETADFAAAVLAAQRAAGRPADADAAERIAGEGRSLTALTLSRGVFVVLNLTRSPAPETVRRRLAHEYVHYVQSAAGGTLAAYPMWFVEGLAEFQMERVAGADGDQRAGAARREREGTAPRLPDLVTPDGWGAAEAALGPDAVYSRAYAALAFLAGRWGPGVHAHLLAAGSDADPGRFERALAEITALDTAGVDAALGAWLRALGGRVTFYNDSPLGQRLYLADGRVLDIPACRECAFLRGTDTCRTDGRPSLSLELPPGEHDILRVVPDNRVHFPDSVIRLHIEPGSALVRCLGLRVG